ncbi:hypothetical protein PFBG_03133 [Plasmodium falciparum 7G8]|uniref:Uncharacterized protein n=1 Tax=Plasmodium falciparum (isolate 7G8) TaxID=57266 RepID=W7FC32_PLAF8|nr:hypothetical protein PFBG_03133 [Plasmodium falciparum 7G8]
MGICNIIIHFYICFLFFLKNGNFKILVATHSCNTHIKMIDEKILYIYIIYINILNVYFKRKFLLIFIKKNLLFIKINIFFMYIFKCVKYYKRRVFNKILNISRYLFRKKLLTKYGTTKIKS